MSTEVAAEQPLENGQADENEKDNRVATPEAGRIICSEIQEIKMSQIIALFLVDAGSDDSDSDGSINIELDPIVGPTSINLQVKIYHQNTLP